jgi:Domain of unknown function (DUF4845)
MKGDKRYRIGAESGVSLSGLIVVLFVLGAVALVAIRVTPALIEYRAVKEALARAKAEAAGGGGIRAIRDAFDKTAGINDVTAISGRDLVITRDGDSTEISFAYEKRVPLAGNVSLLFDFNGTTDPSGVAAKKADAADK